MTDTVSDLVVSSFQSRYEQLTCELKQSALQLRAIFSYLRTKYPDLRSIEITYDGGGDSGQVEDTRFWSKPGDWNSKIEVDTDEVLSDELACGRTARKGHWCTERNAWVHDEKPRNENIGEALDRICWDIAYGQNPCFEINKGGFGTVSVFIDPDNNPDEVKVELQHSKRVEVTNNYSYDF